MSSSSVVSSGPQIDVSLYSVFASRKKGSAESEEKAGHSAGSMLPGNFQVSAKIDEESRKDNMLVISFLVTLNDDRGLSTYEFRGACSISGSAADFESVMEPNKISGSKVPKILDVIYQRLYPVVFMMAGMTMSSFPRSTNLLGEMVSAEPPSTRAQLEEVYSEAAETVAEPPAAKATTVAAEQPAQPGGGGSKARVRTTQVAKKSKPKPVPAAESDADDAPIPRLAEERKEKSIAEQQQEVA